MSHDTWDSAGPWDSAGLRDGGHGGALAAEALQLRVGDVQLLEVPGLRAVAADALSLHSWAHIKV